jgi:hypothetical protein
MPVDDEWGRLAMLRLVARLVRRDCHRLGHAPTPGNIGGWRLVHAPVSDALLRQHLAGERVVAVYPMAARSSETRVGILDIDNKRGAPWDRVAAVARRIISAGKAFGVYPCPVRSGGGHGAHLWARWDEPQRAADVRARMRGILEQAGLTLTNDNCTVADQHGIVVELFPWHDDAPAVSLYRRARFAIGKWGTFQWRSWAYGARARIALIGPACRRYNSPSG